MMPNVLRLASLTTLLVLCVFGVAGFTTLIFETSAPPPSQRIITTEEWASRRTKVEGDKVSITLGDTSGGGGSNNDSILSIALLSPMLKKYPKATTFTVSWCYVVAMGTDNFELVYSRKRSTLIFKSNWRGSPPQVQQFSEVVDSMIHAAAEKGDSYSNLNRYK